MPKEKNIKFKLNGKSLSVAPGTTIMAAAKKAGIDIPSLCHHPDFRPKGNCRVCVVEVLGRNRLATSCSTPVEEGMEVFTDSAKAAQGRNMNLELIYAEHIEKCPTCIWRFECPLLAYAKKYKLMLNRFPDRKSKRGIFKFANAVELDSSQCIDCRNCIDACSILQNINYLKLEGKGRDQEVVPEKHREFHCILCGQCALHCPVSAAQEQSQWDKVEELLKEKDIIKVAQIAPSIRASIGEPFGLPYGSIVTGQVVSGLKQLGFDHVFDVNFAADVTTIVEAEELLERIKSGGTLPMITSCCPGWVNYIEWYHPQILPHLTTSRSPQIHNGGIIKTFWAKKMGVDPNRIRVVSIMPCTAKKFEAERKEMFIDGSHAVDNVLTNRELIFLFKKNRIDLSALEDMPCDSPLGDYSGGAALFGGSGGVMESALRTAHAMACGSKASGICRRRIDFEVARGMAGVKDAVVEVAGNKLRIAVVNGIGNVEPVLENLSKYHYIEVMACPGGCIGGGGQPIPTTPEIRLKRMESLYTHDKARKIRISSENKGAQEVIAWIKGQGKGLEHKLLHTNYKKRITWK